MHQIKDSVANTTIFRPGHVGWVVVLNSGHVIFEEDVLPSGETIFWDHLPKQEIREVYGFNPYGVMVELPKGGFAHVVFRNASANMMTGEQTIHAQVFGCCVGSKYYEVEVPSNATTPQELKHYEAGIRAAVTSGRNSDVFLREALRVWEHPLAETMIYIPGDD